MLFATAPPSHASVSSLQDQEQYEKYFLLAVDISKSLYVSVSCSLWFYWPIQRSGIWHSHLGNVHCDRFLALEWTRVTQHRLCCCSLIRGASSSMLERSTPLPCILQQLSFVKSIWWWSQWASFVTAIFYDGRSDTFWAASSRKVMTGTHFVILPFKLYCCGDFSVVLW